MPFHSPSRPRCGLRIREHRFQQEPKSGPTAHGAFSQPGYEEPVKEFIELRAIPPAVDIGFAQSIRALAQDAGIEMRIVDSDVPGVSSIDFNASRREDL